MRWGWGWVRGVVFWCGWVCVMPSTYNRTEMHEKRGNIFCFLNIYKIYKKMGLVGWKYLASLFQNRVCSMFCQHLCVHLLIRCRIRLKSHSLQGSGAQIPVVQLPDEINLD